MGGGRGASGKGGSGSNGSGKGHGRWNANLEKVLQSLQQQNAQQQQLLRALGDSSMLAGTPGQRSSRGEGAGGGLGGGAKGGGRRDASHGGWGSTDARPGDWTCAQCGASPCFARTNRCFVCRAPRRDGAVADGARPTGGGRFTAAAGRDVYLGPVGANGSRPLLGGRGGGSTRIDGSPTRRVPGASQAAKVEEERKRGSNGDPQHGQTERSVTPAAAAAVPPARSLPRGANPAPIPTRNSWAALTEEEQESDDAMDAEQCQGMGGDEDDDHEDAMGDGNGEAGGDDEEEQPTEAELKQRWIAHCAVVRRLEKDGQPLPPGMLATVKAQRDAAERQWKAAKTPHPLHKRLRWAEADLRAAEAKERARRKELDDYLQQVDLHTREIKARLEVDEARTARKREALAELQREAGLSSRSHIEQAARAAATGIGTDIAPALTAIIEQLGESDEGLRCDLQLLSTSLGKVEHILKEAAARELTADEQRQQQGPPRPPHHLPRPPARFDISDATTTCDGDGDGGNREADGGGACKHRRLAEGAAAAAGSASRWTRPTDSAPWRRSTPSAEAVEEARKLLRESGGTQGTDGGGGASSADTNDLALAARRAEEESLRQQREALQQRQRLLDDPSLLQAEEEKRKQREVQRQEELRRHQEAIAKAAAEAAAEEARQREEAWASMSPEQRALATKALEQQSAVGAHIFGTSTASHAAGLVHQSHVHEVAQEHMANQEAEIQLLMEMSPEEFNRWERERQSLM